MRRRKWCAHCKTHRVEVNSPSKDYCINCHTSIKERLENPMAFARAAGALCLSQPNNEELKFKAFMSVFHPQYTPAQVQGSGDNVKLIALERMYSTVQPETTLEDQIIRELLGRIIPGYKLTTLPDHEGWYDIDDKWAKAKVALIDGSGNLYVSTWQKDAPDIAICSLDEKLTGPLGNFRIIDRCSIPGTSLATVEVT